MLVNQPRREPVAIVGSSCRFPGPATSPAKLWDLLLKPTDISQVIPVNRFDVDGFYHPNGNHRQTTNVRRSYFLHEDHRLFDATFFNMHPREAEAIDPQQRLLLETVHEALESAGFTIESMQGSDSAVYVGAMCYDFKDHTCTRDPANMPEYAGIGTAPSLFANRVSYFFDWKGPSMTIDTACSSSLVAVHQAVQTLRNGEASVAVAAGVNIILGPEMYIAESKLHMLSPSGRCQMWDADADGYARGEGFAAIILKTLSQALHDGDHIECIIRETGVGQDGRTPGITMPGVSSQAALIRETYQRAGLDLSKGVDRPQYFEAHGTGTQAGDPVEAEAVHRAFFHEEGRPTPGSPMYVGSVKTVIGHLEGAAGLAGVLKASLALKHGLIPPNLHFKTLNPKIGPFYGDLQIPTEQVPWPELPPGYSRRASVNSFGFGGTNAHCILESYEKNGISSVPATRSPQLMTPITVSTKSEHSLRNQVKEYLNYLKCHPSCDLEDIAGTLQSNRSRFQYRQSFHGSTREDLELSMNKWLQNPVCRQPAPPGRGTFRILGIFTGQGAQWAGMGSELLRTSLLARELFQAMQSSLGALPEPPSWRLTEEILANPDHSRMGEASVSQPCGTAVQIVLVDLLRAAGVQFHTVVGHSAGEIAAAYAAGYISSVDAIRIAYYRGLYSHLAKGHGGVPGAMIAVGLSLEDAEAFCGDPEFAGRISVAASNSPSSTTLSGDRDAIEKAKALFDSRKTFARLLRLDVAYHSHHMHPCAKAYLAAMQNCTIKVSLDRPSCIWVSSVCRSGAVEDLQTLQADYWKDNMVNPVRFSQALEIVCSMSGSFDAAIEVGPHAALKGPVCESITASTGTSVAYHGTLDRSQNDVVAMSRVLGFVWELTHDPVIDFDRYRRTFFAPSFIGPNLVKGLPAYSWDHQRVLWKDSRVSRRYLAKSTPFHELLGTRCPDDTDDERRWRNVFSLQDIPWISHHKVQGQIVVPGAAYLVMALEAASALCESSEVESIEILNLDIRRAISLDEASTVELLFSLTHDTKRSSPQKIFARFSCSAGSETTSMDGIFHGEVVVHIGKAMPRASLPPSGVGPSLSSIDTGKFYAFLERIGLQYSGMFRALDSVRAGEGVAFASSLSPCSQYIVHPSVLDGALQCFLAACSSQDEFKVWSPLIPYHFERIRFNRGLVYKRAERDTKLSIECNITSQSHSGICGDAEIFQGAGDSIVQFEGVRCKRMGNADPADDRRLFNTVTWELDISAGTSFPVPDHTDSEIDLIDACERTSVFYYRQLRATVTPDEVAAAEWHHQRLFEYIDHVLNEIDQGLHPLVRQEWSHDTHSDVQQVLAAHPESADLQLIHAVGQNLARVVRERTTMLEYMLEDGKLTRYYEQGWGFPNAYKSLELMVRQIVHRYPRMNILEVGAGTGGATKRIFSAMNGAFSSFCFSDISSGFFEKAQELFQHHSHKMQFKTLDVERDPLSQGFQEGGFDLIIASLVLHATKYLSDTLSHVRRLLRPGGFLLLVEGTGKPLGFGFVMCGLPGWWTGADDGRKWGPMASSHHWDQKLRATGFSGIDLLVPNSNDPKRHVGSVFLTQAIDSRTSFFRQPLAYPGAAQQIWNYSIIGGSSETTSNLRKDVSSLLEPWNKSPGLVDSISGVDAHPASDVKKVLLLSELDDPIFKSLSQRKLEALQWMVDHASHVLLVIRTDTEDFAYANMMLGLFRTLRHEMRHLRLQVLCVDGSSLDAALIANTFLRLIDFVDDDSMVFSLEAELLYRRGQLLIPRIIEDRCLNDRHNAQRRLVVTNVEPSIEPVEIASSGYSVVLHTGGSAPRPKPDELVVQNNYCTLQPVRVGGETVFISVGRLVSSDQRVVAFASSNSSVVLVPRQHVFEIQIAPETEADFLVSLSSHVIARELLRRMPCSGTILVHGASEALHHAISQEADRRGCFAYFTFSDLAKCLWSDAHFVHPRTSRRELRHLLSDIRLRGFADFSRDEELSGKIRECFPNVVEITPLAENSIGEWADIIDDAKAALETALSDNSHTGLAQSHSLTLPAKAVASIEPSTQVPHIVDWTKRKTVPAQVKQLDPSALFSSEKTYLLVGLTSDLGRSICRWMVLHGVRYIVLTSRAPQVDQGWLEGLRAMGAVVQVRPLDITDREALHHAYAEISRDLPPVAGVANGAMVLHDNPFLGMSFEQMDRVLRPKVDGSRYLDELFANEPLDFFIMFSSVAWVIGNPGQSNYSAANAYMAALATMRRARGQAASIIDIGVVTGVGYINRCGASFGEELVRKLGVTTIREHELHTVFAEAIVTGRSDSSHVPELVTQLVSQNVSEEEKARWPWINDPIFSHLSFGGDERHKIVERVSNKTPKLSLNDQLALISEETEALEVLERSFSSKLAFMLQLQTVDIAASTALIDFGLDSLIAVEIRSWLTKELGVDVPVFKLLGGATLSEISREAFDQFKKLGITNHLPPPTVSSLKGTALGVSSLTARDPDESRTVSASFTDSAPDRLMANGTLSKPSKMALMSYSQQRTWAVGESTSIPYVNNATWSFDINGWMHIPYFERAFQFVLLRHQALQTRFFRDEQDGQLKQEIMPHLNVRLERKEVVSDAEIQSEFERIRDSRYVLKEGMTMNAVLLSRSEESHVLILGLHHIVFDMYSILMFLDDLDCAYRQLDLKTVQYDFAHFATREKHLLENGSWAQSISFWKDEYALPPPPVPLFPFANVLSRQPMREYHLHGVGFTVTSDQRSRIQQTASSFKASPFHIHMSVLQALMSVLLGIDDLVIGNVDANRGEKDFSETFGPLFNYVPIRFKIDRNWCFKEIVSNTRRTTNAAQGHAHVPFDYILDMLDIERMPPTHHPLYQIQMNYVRHNMDQPLLADLEIKPRAAAGVVMSYDLVVSVFEGASETLIMFYTQKYLYSWEATNLLKDAYVKLLDAYVDDPSLGIGDVLPAAIVGSLASPATNGETMNGHRVD
jgi:acyl transferase domain-containing protein/NADP-dependent 3-hydroxy acid dehydrogenase YdfG/acyl carrier protein